MTSGSKLSYSTFSELDAHTGLVVKGTKVGAADVILTREGVDGLVTDNRTLSIFVLHEIFKNESDHDLADGQTIVVQENAAADVTTVYSTAGYQLMNEQEDYLLFLRESLTDPGVYIIRGIVYGKVPAAEADNLLADLADVQFQGSEQTRARLKTIFEDARTAYLKEAVEDVMSIETFYFKQRSVEDLEREADVILKGTPKNRFADREHVTTTFSDGTVQDFYTMTQLSVSEVVKKPAELDVKAGDDFIVAEPIGYMDPAAKTGKVTPNDYVELKKGNEYLIFLKANDEGTYFVMNLNLGKFDLSGGLELSPSISAAAADSFKKEYQKFWDELVGKYQLK
ncbi:hypothetical protein [Paenibacillus sp. 1P07SE]|uniref:hypothetical protein n=1 Tax=Paenibacillus sp. 1P07SE TaxID=3132209 RepID=UPI0039A45CD5